MSHHALNSDMPLGIYLMDFDLVRLFYAILDPILSDLNMFFVEWRTKPLHLLTIH